jgi:asparagine synthase (glutamine-hydrolysing)
VTESNVVPNDYFVSESDLSASWVQYSHFFSVFNGRIDNSDYLNKLLCISSAEGSSCHYLVTKAYEKWGELCVNYIEGSFAFAVYDSSNGELFLANDAMGNNLFYYFSTSTQFYFSFYLKHLLQKKEVHVVLNEKYLSCILSGVPFTSTETAYQNICFSSAGSALVIKEGRIVRSFSHQINSANIDRIPSKDFVEGFLYYYRRSIHNCLRNSGEVGSTLSGGLDSGSVSALAAEELAKLNKRLHCYTSIPTHEVKDFVRSRFGNEFLYAAATANRYKNIVHHCVQSDSTSFINNLKKIIQLTCSPVHGAANVYWIYDILSQIKNESINTLLIGQSGNITVSWKGIPNFKAEKETLIKPFLAMSSDRINALVKDNMEEFNAGRSKVLNTVDARIQTISQQTRAMSFWNELANESNIKIYDPTRDRALFKFCLAIPDSFNSSDQYNRLLIRRAMEGVLPLEVQWNKRTGMQASDNLVMAKIQHAEISELLLLFQQSESVNQYLNLKEINNAFLQLMKSNPSKETRVLFSRFMRALNVGLFIMQVGKE